MPEQVTQNAAFHQDPDEAPVIIRKPILVPGVISSGATTDLTISLPPGTYEIAMYTRTGVTGAPVITGHVFLNAAQTRVSETELGFAILNQAGAAAASFTVTTGATKGEYVLIRTNRSATSAELGLPLAYGFQITVTWVGTEGAAEEFELEFVCSRRNAI